MSKVKTKKKPAKLRVCASCEWVFTAVKSYNCPECGFVSYGAHYVYGKTAYTYKYTQKPWREKKLFQYGCRLRSKIRVACPKKPKELKL